MFNKYPTPAVTADVVIFTIENGQLKVLLIKRADKPFKDSWALPGGFLHINETPEESANRILKEKAGVKGVYTEQLYTFDKKGRDPRGHILSVAYFALVPFEKIKTGSGPEFQTPTFTAVKKLPKLAFDHKDIIGCAIKRLQAKLEYTNVVYSILPKQFTFLELQKAYEYILDKRVDKRNFRKKFMQLGLILPTKKITKGTRQRPAKLYEFRSHKPSELKKFF